MAKLCCILIGLFACGAGMNAAAGEGNACRSGEGSGVESTPLRPARGPKELQRALQDYDELQTHAANYRKELARHAAKSNDDYKEVILALEKQIAVIEKQIAETSSLIDQLGGQRGCSVSRLYWYTDLAEAKAAAEKTGRPILSLRMLGKLTDEYSCANSRFFRTTLYSNKEVSEFLRTNFVLHWQSVRPVPRVTIDFGDGRKLERTITGNSAHYILASDGTPLDVLPGLYSPLAFRQHLWEACSFSGKHAVAPVGERAALVQAYHQEKERECLRQWDYDIQALGEQRAALVTTRINSAMEFARLDGQTAPKIAIAPKAAVAGRRAMGNFAVEAPMIRLANLGGAWMERGMDDEVWQAIANVHRADVKLDDSSVAVVRKEFPAAVAMRAAISKSRQEDPVLRMVRTFEDSIAVDTVRNEYLLHRRIHEKFGAKDAVTTDFEVLNEWVYAELFLTPSSDPWLGLAPNDVYTALENDGQTAPVAPVAEHAGG